MVRERGTLGKVQFGSTFYSCYVSALFSDSFRLVSGHASMCVIPYVVFHTSAGLFSANQTASNTHRSRTLLVPSSHHPFGTDFYTWLHKRMNPIMLFEVWSWYSVTFNLSYPKYGAQCGLVRDTKRLQQKKMAPRHQKESKCSRKVTLTLLSVVLQQEKSSSEEPVQLDL